MVRDLVAPSAIALFALTGACTADRFTYVPREIVGPTKSHAQAVYYPIWAGPREGSVTVSFLGLTSREPKQGERDTQTARVRMDVTNETQSDWTLDAKDNAFALPGHQGNQAAYLEVGAQKVSAVDIKAGATQSLDFFFPLPDDVADWTDLPDFTFAWEIKAPGQIIAQTTVFERVHVGRYLPERYARPAYSDEGVGVDGFGPGPYWYDQYWVPAPNSSPAAGAHVLPPKNNDGPWDA